jgi:zinc metalloprotease ZmpB
MQKIYDPGLNATVTLDDSGRIRGITHTALYRDVEHLRGREAATAYVRSIAGALNIASEELRTLEQPVSYLDPQPRDAEYRFSEEKVLFDSATYAYFQTWLNTPVWEAGITVTIKQPPARVVAATNTSEQGIDAKMPSAQAVERYRRLFATGEKADGSASRPAARRPRPSDTPGSDLLSDILGDLANTSTGPDDRPTAPRLIRGRFFVYRYDPARRSDGHPEPTPTTYVPEGATQPIVRPLSAPAPTLPLQPAPKSIQAGHWYLVAELIVRLTSQGRTENWRLLVDVETNAILNVRALTSAVDGLIFPQDPITLTGNNANSPAATAATLDPVRSARTLLNLTAPAPGANQALSGDFVQISDFELATIAPPTEAAGTNFSYGSRTNDFAAVNAYYHCDRFFRLVEELGFTISSYFDGTTFPVPVDHRGRFGSANGIEVNASCSGDGDGIANVDFELADMGDTTNPIGIANDWRVVLHELAGHGIIYEHCGATPNFNFAHSAGDSFAVILNDPTTQAPDRFESYPWVSAIGRRHDRTVAAGWGWGGPNDDLGYLSEQILSTTLFRVYRSIGGDSTSLSRREFAARCMAYLMLRAVGTLTPMSNPSAPAQFLDALLTADAGNWTSAGMFGGAYGKVLTWSFETQNLNNGARPLVDVYIDDGRAGEYAYLADFSATATIWNRRSPGGTTHEEPALWATNYAYVKIKNRGTAVATNVSVRGYHCKPLAGLVWPNDLQPMTTPELPAGTLQPNNTEEKTIGPFEWTPVKNAWGQDGILMIVSAPEDRSNADSFTAGEMVEDWRLVPNDNNIALRKVTFPPRLVTVIADAGDFKTVCPGSVKDMALGLSNSGYSLLTISNISSSSGEFLVPSVVSYPLTIEAGTSTLVPIRFQPSSVGPKSATLTVTSDDPAGPRIVAISGVAPSGKLAVTGSLCFGGVKACCRAERTLSICNVGDCNLHVTSVAFKRKSPHWKLINNPFPATLHPGSCLGVVIRYKATEKCPVCCELLITSDDPTTPVKTLDVMAYTIWNQAGCKQGCDECRKGGCSKGHPDCCCEGSADDCCQDEEDGGKDGY